MEARWAVFMDSMRVKWVYELDGYRLPSGVCYLPDFYLPDLAAWMEVKNPAAVNFAAEKAKVEGLVSLTGKPAYFFDFPPALPKYADYEKGQICFLQQGDAAWDDGYLWCECPQCGQVGFQYDGRADRINCGCRHEGRIAGYDTDRLQDAFWMASAKRFEKGGEQ